MLNDWILEKNLLKRKEKLGNDIYYFYISTADISLGIEKVFSTTEKTKTALTTFDTVEEAIVFAEKFINVKQWEGDVGL